MFVYTRGISVVPVHHKHSVHRGDCCTTDATFLNGGSPKKNVMINGKYNLLVYIMLK